MAEKASGGVAAVCRRLAQPVAEELGLTLWDVRFVKEGASWYLRYIIDKEGGAGLDDCVALSRRMDSLLDEADPISQSYSLEVSTPGVERELTRPEHFTHCEGWAVALRLYHAVDGEREFAGILQGLRDENIVIETEEGTALSFPRKEVARIHVIDDDTLLSDELG